MYFIVCNLIVKRYEGSEHSAKHYAKSFVGRIDICRAFDVAIGSRTKHVLCTDLLMPVDNGMNEMLPVHYRQVLHNSAICTIFTNHF